MQGCENMLKPAFIFTLHQTLPMKRTAAIGPQRLAEEINTISVAGRRFSCRAQAQPLRP